MQTLVYEIRKGLMFFVCFHQSKYYFAISVLVKPLQRQFAVS